MPPVVGPCWAWGVAVTKITTMGDSYPDLKSQTLITRPADLNIHMQVLENIMNALTCLKKETLLMYLHIDYLYVFCSYDVL